MCRAFPALLVAALLAACAHARPRPLAGPTAPAGLPECPHARGESLEAATLRAAWRGRLDDTADCLLAAWSGHDATRRALAAWLAPERPGAPTPAAPRTCRPDTAEIAVAADAPAPAHAPALRLRLDSASLRALPPDARRAAVLAAGCAALAWLPRPNAPAATPRFEVAAPLLARLADIPAVEVDTPDAARMLARADRAWRRGEVRRAARELTEALPALPCPLRARLAPPLALVRAMAGLPSGSAASNAAACSGEEPSVRSILAAQRCIRLRAQGLPAAQPCALGAGARGVLGRAARSAASHAPWEPWPAALARALLQRGRADLAWSRPGPWQFHAGSIVDPVGVERAADALDHPDQRWHARETASLLLAALRKPALAAPWPHSLAALCPLALALPPAEASAKAQATVRTDALARAIRFADVCPDLAARVALAVLRDTWHRPHGAAGAMAQWFGALARARVPLVSGAPAERRASWAAAALAGQLASRLDDPSEQSLAAFLRAWARATQGPPTPPVEGATLTDEDSEAGDETAVAAKLARALDAVARVVAPKTTGDARAPAAAGTAALPGALAGALEALAHLDGKGSPTGAADAAMALSEALTAWTARGPAGRVPYTLVSRAATAAVRQRAECGEPAVEVARAAAALLAAPLARAWGMDGDVAALVRGACRAVACAATARAGEATGAEAAAACQAAAVASIGAREASPAETWTALPAGVRQWVEAHGPAQGAPPSGPLAWVAADGAWERGDVQAAQAAYERAWTQSEPAVSCAFDVPVAAGVALRFELRRGAAGSDVGIRMAARPAPARCVRVDRAPAESLRTRAALRAAWAALIASDDRAAQRWLARAVASVGPAGEGLAGRDDALLARYVGALAQWRGHLLSGQQLEIAAMARAPVADPCETAFAAAGGAVPGMLPGAPWVQPLVCAWAHAGQSVEVATLRAALVAASYRSAAVPASGAAWAAHVLQASLGAAPAELAGTLPARVPKAQPARSVARAWRLLVGAAAGRPPDYVHAMLRLDALTNHAPAAAPLWAVRLAGLLPPAAARAFAPDALAALRAGDARGIRLAPWQELSLRAFGTGDDARAALGGLEAVATARRAGSVLPSEARTLVLRALTRAAPAAWCPRVRPGGPQASAVDALSAAQRAAVAAAFELACRKRPAAARAVLVRARSTLAAAHIEPDRVWLEALAHSTSPSDLLERARELLALALVHAR